MSNVCNTTEIRINFKMLDKSSQLSIEMFYEKSGTMSSHHTIVTENAAITAELIQKQGIKSNQPR